MTTLEQGFNPPKYPAGALRSAARRGLSRDELDAETSEARRRRDEQVKKVADERAAAVRRPRMIVEGGGQSVLVDPSLLEAYRDITRMSIELLEHTERGGATAYKTVAYLTLVDRLKDVEVLLDVSRGSGESILDLVSIIELTADD